MPKLPQGRFPGPAPPAELLRGWGWPRDVFGGSWGGVRAGRAREGRSYPDRTVSPAHPSPSHARGLRGVVSSERFEKARGEGGGARGRSAGRALIGRGRPPAFPHLDRGHAYPESGAASHALPGLDRSDA